MQGTDADRPGIADLLHIEQKLWVWTRPTGSPIYDFRFDQLFECRRPWRLEEPVTAVARAGAAAEYAERYEALSREDIRLVHTPEQYERASLLPRWYPFVKDLTPRSQWFDRLPTLEEIEGAFEWPVFLKGERQTSRHQAELSIIHSREQFQDVMRYWQDDPILRWQRVVCREFVPLRPAALGGAMPAGSPALPVSFEFRSFWWYGACVGFGPYWIGHAYKPTAAEEAAAIAVAGEAARRLDVPFVVVDIAQDTIGRWIVIECNDGQDSGYAGVSPMLMWRRILDAEDSRTR